MKKMTFIACAAMLTSAIALTSCKGDEPQGSFEGTAEVVKTEFAISLPGNVAGGPNKMKATTVQTTPAQFQGMTSLMLVPFATADSIEGADTRLGKNIALTGDILSTGSNNPSGDSKLGDASNARVYSDVAVPLTTASFLFYGKSAATGSKFQVGSLIPDTASAHNTPAEFSFKLDSIITTTAMDNLMTSGAGKNLLTWLTNIASAVDDGGKKWYEYTESMTGDSAAYYAMFQAYDTLVYLSSKSVSRVLTDLYQSLLPLSTTLATNIKAAIAAGSTYAYVNGSTGTVDMKSGYDKFPEVYGLPDCAVGIKWETNQFRHMTAGEYTAANRTQPNKYVYPAQLWYYANSTIKTSNSSKKSMYNDSNDWATILAAHGDATAVNTLTRAIVLKDSIQYGVARLDVQVRLSEASGTMADNSESAEGVATPVDISGGLPVTAILVGGQNHVGYNFQPTAAGAYTVYDTVMAAPMLAAPSVSYSAMNHTLVLESVKSTDVRVAVEMENTTGVDFYGYGNQLIPAGAKFYVVANLTANDATETGKKVFKQDYTTTAKLKLNDLKKAYNTIPDLRTPELEIGFAVSLSWQNGHEYTVDFE